MPSIYKTVALVSLVSLAAAVAGFLAGQSANFPLSQAESRNVENTKTCDLLSKIKEEQIAKIQSWEDENGRRLVAVVRKLDEPCDEDYVLSSCEKLSIYDEKGKAVYELKDFEIRSIEPARLKANSRQFIVAANGGGTDDVLKILDYQDGKFTEIVGGTETQTRGGYWTMPQYGSGIVGAYFKPAQLFVIQQIGGADSNPSAAVFRWRENEFQKVGDISMRQLGDFIERRIAPKH